MATSSTAPWPASARRSSRASTENACGSVPWPYRMPGTRPSRRRRRVERECADSRGSTFRDVDSAFAMRGWLVARLTPELLRGVVDAPELVESRLALPALRDLAIG